MLLIFNYTSLPWAIQVMLLRYPASAWRLGESGWGRTDLLNPDKIECLWLLKPPESSDLPFSTLDRVTLPQSWCAVGKSSTWGLAWGTDSSCDQEGLCVQPSWVSAVPVPRPGGSALNNLIILLQYAVYEAVLEEHLEAPTRPECGGVCSSGCTTVCSPNTAAIWTSLAPSRLPGAIQGTGRHL